MIEGTLSGKSYWPDSTPAVQLGNTLSCGLSDQELETLRLLCEGQTNAEIAAGMNVAESTVRTYINRMLEKTGYPNRNRLMVAAPLTTTYVWMDDAEMKHTWLVRNIYIRPDKHLEIQPLSLQR